MVQALSSLIFQLPTHIYTAAPMYPYPPYYAYPWYPPPPLPGHMPASPNPSTAQASPMKESKTLDGEGPADTSSQNEGDTPGSLSSDLGNANSVRV
jgi:hypothetical protein